MYISELLMEIRVITCNFKNFKTHNLGGKIVFFTFQGTKYTEKVQYYCKTTTKKCIKEIINRNNAETKINYY